MTKENVKRTSQPSSWSAKCRHLANLDKPALLALVKDLYEASGGNRDFIQARCQAGENGVEILEKYRGKIVEQGDYQINVNEDRGEGGMLPFVKSLGRITFRPREHKNIDIRVP